MGLRGEAAIVGYVELPPEQMRKASPAPFTLEQWAELAAAALEDQRGLMPDFGGAFRITPAPSPRGRSLTVRNVRVEPFGSDAIFEERSGYRWYCRPRSARR